MKFSQRSGVAALICGLMVLAGCEETGHTNPGSVTKGDVVSPNSIYAAHAGQYFCSGYESRTDSCETLGKIVVSGNSVVASETALVGENEPLEIITRGRVKGDAVCFDASGISIGQGPKGPAVDFALEYTKKTMASYGGSCTTYYRSDNGYVAKTVGGNGKAIPGGEVFVRVFETPKPLRLR